MRRHAKAPSVGSTSSSVARLRGLFAVAALATLALALGASPAFALKTHPFEASFGAGSLTGPGALAVNQGDGSVYVADSVAGGKVLKFDSAGFPANFSALGSNALGAEFPNVAQIASGGPAENLYIANNAEQKLDAFASSGEPAAFSASASYISGNSITGTPDGNYQFLCGATVDVNGAIYAGDYFQGIRVYAPSGELITSIPTTNSCKLAVDSAGNLYVAGFGGNVSVWTPSAFPVTASTTYSGPTTVYEGGVTGIAVDPADDDLYVNGGSYVAQYDALANGNALVGQFGAEELAAGSTGVAIDRSGGPNDGDIYASTGARVDRFGSLATVPGVLTGAATNRTPSSATLNGTVDPDGIEPSECKFEYGTTAAYGATVPCAESNASIGSGSGPVSVHADVSGLAPVDYHFRLVAANGNGRSKGQDAGFSIVAPPVIGNESSSVDYPEASYAEAVLRGSVNPNNAATTYYFEYGTTTDYGESTTVRQLAVGINPRDVLALVSPLDKGQTYHFRLVASNSAGTNKGADQILAVQSSAPSDTCSNAAIRAKQGSAFLPDCRAYELVSPAAKGNIPVDSGQTVQAAPKGDAVAFVANGAFPGAAASVVNTYYVARRSAQGWSTGLADSPQYNPADQPARPTRYFSTDLTRAFQFSAQALLPSAFEGGSNLYLRDLLSGQLTLAASEPGLLLGRNIAPFTDRAPIGASDDLSRVVFQTAATLTPDSLPGVNNIYEFANGQLSLVNRLPDGSVDPGGAVMQGEIPGVRSVSDDGERTVFQAPFSPFDAPLYLRVNGSTTIPLSVSRIPGDPDTVLPVNYLGGSDDLRHIFFSTRTPMLPGAPQGLRSGVIYRYDVDSEDLTVAAPEAEIRAISSDGSTIYYVGQDEADNTPPFAPVYASRGGVTKRVATLGFFENLTAKALSPTGRYFAFTTEAKVTENENTSPRCHEQNGGNRCSEVYLFDFQSGVTKCVSCAPVDGVDAEGKLGNTFRGVSEYLPRALSDDGRLFFNSDARLVAADANEKTDVYEWRAGDVYLISPAGGQDSSYFADASADGSSIFFTTTQRLVADDTDGEADVYAARTYGGLAAQNQPPPAGPSACAGEACRGPLSPPARTEAPASAGFSGPANVKPQRHKKKKRAKHKRHQKKKGHVKKAHPRDAHSNRGGGR